MKIEDKMSVTEAYEWKKRAEAAEAKLARFDIDKAEAWFKQQRGKVINARWDSRNNTIVFEIED